MPVIVWAPARPVQASGQTGSRSIARWKQTSTPAPEIVRRALVLPEPSDGLVDHPNRADIISVSVGTDPNLALKTRKGHRFYHSAPSLKGVWYPSLFNHATDQ